MEIIGGKGNERKSKIKYMSSGRIYGLDKDEDNNYIIKEEANVVRLIFKLWIYTV